MGAENMDELVSLCKRRGFIYQTNEIYGGLQGLYDYGPLGVELKNNLKNSWWSSMVYERDDVEGLDSSILTHPNVLKYSGHEETFTDPLVDCKDCKSRWRADHIKDNLCPSCGSDNLTKPRPFNLMFKTNVGPVDDANSTGFCFVAFDPNSALQRVQGLLRRTALYLSPIYFFVIGLGVQKSIFEWTIIGQQEQSFAVLVQASSRVYSSGKSKIRQCFLVGKSSKLAQIPIGFVKEDIQFSHGRLYSSISIAYCQQRNR